MSSAPQRPPRLAAIKAEILPVVTRNIVAARYAAGLSQEELARQAGTDRTRMSRIERGDSNVTIVTLVAIARSLGVSPADLLAEIR